MDESINNLQKSFTLNKTKNQEYFKAKNGAKRIIACFHCATIRITNVEMLLRAKKKIC
jgi:hypothetical protein